MLRDLGYYTVLQGLQHISEDALGLGFDECAEGGRSEEVARRVEAWLDDRCQRGDTRPFYLEVGFEDTHRPWGWHDPDMSLGAERFRWLPPYEGDDQEIAAFQGEIRAVDEAVGQITRTLDRWGLRDNTWVIFTTDHGVPMPRAKGTLYDPGIEVALIMSWPVGGITGGTVVSSLASHIDIVPTILEGLGEQVPENVQGTSLWPTLHDALLPPRDAIFAEKTYHNSYDPIRCVRTSDYKLIMHFNTYDTADVPTDCKASPAFAVMREELARQHRYVELYDLQQDPLERRNLAYLEEHALELKRLLAQLREWMLETDDPLLQGMIPSPTYLRSLDILYERVGLSELKFPKPPSLGK